MTAGRRNRLISVERATVTTDDYGGEVQTWGDYAIALAEVLFGTGQERRQAAQEGGTQVATFIVVWSPELAATKLIDRIQGMGAAWNITSVVPIGLGKEIHFTATRSI